MGWLSSRPRALTKAPHVHAKAAPRPSLVSQPPAAAWQPEPVSETPLEEECGQEAEAQPSGRETFGAASEGGATPREEEGPAARVQPPEEAESSPERTCPPECSTAAAAAATPDAAAPAAAAEGMPPGAPSHECTSPPAGAGPGAGKEASPLPQLPSATPPGRSLLPRLLRQGGGAPPLRAPPCKEPVARRQAHGCEPAHCGGGSSGLQAQHSTLSVARSGPSGGTRQGSHPLFGLSFGHSMIRDLPPEQRTLLEDSKVLHEQVRRYKQRAAEQEHATAAAERAALALRSEVAKLRDSLDQCSVQPGTLLQERQFREQLQERELAISQLTQRTAVLGHARESTERRLGAELAVERRRSVVLEQEVGRLKEVLKEQGSQARLNAIHIRSLYQRLQQLEAAVATAGSPEDAPPAADTDALGPGGQGRVHLMLCILGADEPPSEEEAAAAAALAADAAAWRELQWQRTAVVVIQAAARGWHARRAVTRRHAAAVRLQAAARGMLVRRRLRAESLAAAAAAAAQAGEQGAGGEPPEQQLSPLERLAQRQREAEAHYLKRAARKDRPGKRLLPVRPGSSMGSSAAAAAASQPEGDGASTGPQARGAHTSVEAGAARRSASSSVVSRVGHGAAPSMEERRGGWGKSSTAAAGPMRRRLPMPG